MFSQEEHNGDHEPWKIILAERYIDYSLFYLFYSYKEKKYIINIILYSVHKKVKPKDFTITLKTADKIPSNLAHSISDQCLTMWHKNFPLHLRMYAQYLV